MRFPLLDKLKNPPHDPDEMDRVSLGLLISGQFLKNLFHEFIDKGCQKSAAALTYLTMFALVPLLTVMYSVFSMFPVFEGIDQQMSAFIFNNLVHETGAEVQQYLTDFSQQARKLTAVGAAFLIFMAYLMLTNIEKTFNVIWGVKNARRGLVSFLQYWAVLTIGPLLLGAGLAISTYLLSLKIVFKEYDQLGIVTVLFRLAPFVMTSMAFTLLFAAVPNCRVPIKFALIGGAVTAVLFELLKALFGYMVANSSYQFIYGAMAALPLFLLWINLLWTIILAGAVFVRTMAEKGYSDRNARFTDIVAILKCLSVLIENTARGDQATDRDCVRTGVGLVHWQTLRTLLVNQKWIAVTDNGGYVMARDPRTITLWDVAALVKMPINVLERIRARQATHNKMMTHWLETFLESQESVDRFTRDAFAIDLKTLFSRDDSEPEIDEVIPPSEKLPDEELDDDQDVTPSTRTA